MRLNAKQIASYTGGTIVVEPLDGANLLTSITWDSREVQQNSLFVCIIGERVDGHDFVPFALRSGAAAILTMLPLRDSVKTMAREMGAAVIEVADTQHAIRDLAIAWRSFIRGKVIGLTGSVGKTTTKNLVRDVLATRFDVVATQGNQNNELGVPNTLLAANPETQMVVVEMGMRGLGQIEQLCSFVKPDWGIVTNVGTSHIELLGSQQNIARAKAELIASLPQSTGVAFLNQGDESTPFLQECARTYERGIQTVRYGGECTEVELSDGGMRVWAEDVTLNAEGRAEFTLCAKLPDLSEVARQACSLGLRGIHNVSNACAAAAVGLRAGIEFSQIAIALHSAVPEQGRQEVVSARAGYVIVNDAYNANPDSMKASLSMFASMEAQGRRIAVLGDMAELGDYAVACHEGVGRFVAALPIDQVICFGDLAAHIGRSAVEAGYEKKKVLFMQTRSDVLAYLEAHLTKDDAVLLKASNCMQLTKVVEGLISS